MRVADTMQIVVEKANQDSKKGRNIFVLDEDQTITSSLKDNESFKFLIKVTKEERLFDDFIRGISDRGTYQLLDSIRYITVV